MSCPTDASRCPGMIGGLCRSPSLRGHGEGASPIARRSSHRLRAFRRIVSRIRADHRIPDTVKLGLGINPPPRGPKPRVAAPTTAPLLWIVEAQPGRVIMRYADSATPESRSKPHGVQQLQLFVAIGTERISDPEQARYLAAYTRTPFDVPLRDEDDGLMATYFGRWSTRTALVGPWSEPVSMTVIGSGQGRPVKPAEQNVS
jgi:hypothetical protein